ncbi:hypothetical protein Mgra_00006312 [Meloidogyne graminicola]|uniref:AMP-binding domain-containing protein n=1 Tax=Meloidogyne graminicola TaxID=189291 RepID=A0A8S9ZM33_9BILA|nr:hypothetical protein Mgra_00006312 [Meloidogyne graminicola]
MSNLYEKYFNLQILKSIQKFKDDIAITDILTGYNLTFSDIYQKSLKLFYAFKQNNNYYLNKGDVLLCIINNNIYFPVILLGTSLIGILITGASPNSTKEELNYFIKKSNCKAILIENGPNIDWIINKAKELNILIIILNKNKEQIGIDFFEILDSVKDLEIDNLMEELEKNKYIENNLNNIFIAPLSSSTSGYAKIVLLTHQNYISATEILKITTIAAQPFYHASGFWILCYCLLNGHYSLILNEFKPIKYLKLIEEYKIECLSLNPLMISSLVEQLDINNYNLSSVKTIISGGWMDLTNSTKKLINYCLSLKNFINSYGMTEIVLVSHMTPLEMKNDKVTKSIGCLLPGELWLRSKCIMFGYLNEPLLNEKIIDKNGWLHTGDIVYKDIEGFFFVIDRLSNLINVNGNQVWPTELENILLLHPKVKEACVIGIKSNKNKLFEDIPKALIVLTNIDEENEFILLEEILSFANEQLEQYQKITGGIISVKNLPKTPFGKIARGKVHITINFLNRSLFY